MFGRLQTLVRSGCAAAAAAPAAFPAAWTSSARAMVAGGPAGNQRFLHQARTAQADPNVMYHPDDESAMQFEQAVIDVPAATPELRQEISAFLNRVEQPFNDEDLVLLAATHRSWTRIVEVEKEGRGSVESWVGPPVDNNRLSSLGNAALKTALTQYIFVRYPNLDGESITRLTNHLASNEILSLAARNVGYQHLLRCRRAAVVKTDHPDSKRIVADSFSAFVGAVLVDQGSDAASNFALDMLVPVLESTDVTTHMKLHIEPQRTLWALQHREGADAPTYTILKETGRQSHAPMFLVGVFVGDEKLAEGASVSLKDAKKEAAKAALRMKYSQELGANTELPTAWGEFSVGEVKEYISDTQEL